MAFDPNFVERRTAVFAADGTVKTVATRGFGSIPLDIPFGCPPEFAAMIVAAANGDTSLIQRSYEAHPERRQTEYRSQRTSVPERHAARGRNTVLKAFALRDEAKVCGRRRALLNALLD
jgi:hypothetical protein